MARGEDRPTGQQATEAARRPAVLIYDGECAVCRGATSWVRENAAPGAFEYLSCHSADLTRRFPTVARAACLEAMHLVVPDGSIFVGERAIPEILSRLRRRRHRWAAALLRLPGAGILSGTFYRWFARRRHRIARLIGS